MLERRRLSIYSSPRTWQREQAVSTDLPTFSGLLVTATNLPGRASDDVIRGLAHGDTSMLESVVGLRLQNLQDSGLDPRSHALIKVAVLIAMDAPPASYMWQVSSALQQGVTADDLVGLLIAVAPQVGGPRIVAAAGEIAFALGIALEDPGSHLLAGA
jgi:alkylhydroperoxidase/carboxymuconolactone decarboxylase family protein YurZ